MLAMSGTYCKTAASKCGMLGWKCPIAVEQVSETDARSTGRETLCSLVPLSVELSAAFSLVAWLITSMSYYAIFVVGNKAGREVMYRAGEGLIAEVVGRWHGGGKNES